ncbi:hypothetical protein SAMN05421788_103326 [Filimonas lacunae]|uniref:Uncharacterized protein n=1 Tax=Filimonas lacunae TaxID=477680 RepID=A0A173MK12_9BACT|nr:hypothetical protein [Filimonas lacunae]BAV07982.1 hypothetical protein FLA_4015 [Filimonas lacunae]SIT07447.1 hypothetical protein SAMN05421788_103326 [Filimonas lacunae]
MIEGYNLRFSPGMAKVDFMFGLEDCSNVIAKLKKGANLKVLAERIETNKIWLFIETPKESLVSDRQSFDFEFSRQQVRGWVSDKFVVYQ